MAWLLKLAAGLLACSAIAQSAATYHVTVDANDELCFFEDLEVNDSLGMSFQVTFGGFLDIDVEIRSPNGQVVYEANRATEDSAVISAKMAGRYAICFGNHMSTMTPKELMFSVQAGKGSDEAQKPDADASSEQLMQMMRELRTRTMQVHDENKYMSMREIAHRQINDSTHSRVLYWAVFECMVVVAMSIGQVIYLKRFFEQKRMV